LRDRARTSLGGALRASGEQAAPTEVDGDNRAPPALETLLSSRPSVHLEPMLAAPAIEATATE
jgi:hypothetical protein